MAKLFFSYSHKDEAVRDELEVHLAMLKRTGFIETWHDRRIGAGNEIDRAINKNLADSKIILLLISPYFLASDYCYDIELKQALEQHNNEISRVIPVIVDPCDWHDTPFGKLLATPRDGIEISKHPNQHDAFLDIVKAIKQALKELGETNTEQASPSISSIVNQEQMRSPLPRSSNLRIKKSFSEQDKDDFLENTFEYMSKFFEGSLQEIKNRNPDIDTRFKQIDANHFSAVVYKNGNVTSQCKIWLGGKSSFLGGIIYSSDISSNDNSCNDSLHIEDDNQLLYLRHMGGYIDGMHNEETQLSQEGASEYFWKILIQPLQS